MPITKNKTRGFTLLEFLIYAVILTVISAAVVEIFLAMGQSQTQVDIRSEVNSNLRFAIEKISQDLRAASSLSTPAADVPSSPILVMTVGGQTITYDVSGGQLRRQVGVGTPEAITSDRVTVSTPTFLRLENTNIVLAKTTISVQIDLTISSTALVGGSAFSANKKTTISLKW